MRLLLHGPFFLADAAAFIIYHELVFGCSPIYRAERTHRLELGLAWCRRALVSKPNVNTCAPSRKYEKPSILEEWTSKLIDTNPSLTCTIYHNVTRIPLHCTARYCRAMLRRMGPPVRGFYRELDAARPDTQLVFANDASPAVNPCEYRCEQPRGNDNLYSLSISGADTGAHASSDPCGLKGLS